MTEPGKAGGAYALVLAAGGSRRFGSAKMLAVWQGAPLVRAAVDVALASPVERVIVVVGSRSAEIRSALCDAGDGRLCLVDNRDWQSGLASSLLAGLKALPTNADRVVVFLGDMPLVSVKMATLVLNAVRDVPAALPRYMGQPAHPVAFSRSAFGELYKLRGDQGARMTLNCLSDAILIDTNEPGSVFDVDLPVDIGGQQQDN